MFFLACYVGLSDEQASGKERKLLHLGEDRLRNSGKRDERVFLAIRRGFCASIPYSLPSTHSLPTILSPETNHQSFKMKSVLATLGLFSSFTALVSGSPAADAVAQLEGRGPIICIGCVTSGNCVEKSEPEGCETVN